ncbi:MAG: RagB/SusD family nutrient uptake outer membrane protein [Lentimicrobium sp.]|jgi:tetratricopeptide (TPR) repeat protein|nr:RagB/SusD family nutrient uptake outer membrane protein [Lentimicrobium sp.]
MKRIINISLFLVLALGITSCEKYLDVEPKGIVIPKDVKELDGILNSYTSVQSYPAHMLYFSDEVYASFGRVENHPSANAYFWAPQLNNDLESSPVVWSTLYRCIYNTNVIIRKIDGAAGDAEKKQQLLGEALTLRSAYFFDLLTVYAKAFNASTASGDPGIPIMQSVDVTEATPPRSSIQATLDTIISNLNTAIEILPASSLNRSRVNKYTAYALLSRVYLYMENYTQSALFADKALETPHEILDYNEYFSAWEMPEPDLNPEYLWTRLSDDVAAIFYLNYSTELINAYEPDDNRLLLFAADYYGTGEYFWSGAGYGSYGISFPEIYLNKAECLAHNNNIDEAMQILNDLRIKRVSIYSFEPVEAATQEEAIAHILHERKLELAFKGTRWMDMKRLDKQGRMPAVERTELFTGEVLETLPSGSPRYTFKIPGRVMLFNPDMVQN